MDLYQANVQVADDSAAQRSIALAEALAQVLVKVSGSGDIGANPAAARVTAQADALVQQYKYRFAEADPAQRLLWARFDPAAVDRAIRQAGLPLWGRKRPKVLLWVAIERANQREMLNPDIDLQAHQALVESAERRGMPLQLPLLDIQDQSALSPADLWADYTSAIETASARYTHDAILTGRVRELSNRTWRADWKLWSDGQQQSFSSAAVPYAAALQSGIDGAQDRLAERYVPQVMGAGPKRLRVAVDGVDSLRAYGRVLQLLAAQEAVSRVNLSRVDGGRLVFELWASGGPEVLSQNLLLGGELRRQQLSPAASWSGLPQTQAGVGGAEDLAALDAQAVDLSFLFSGG